MILILLYFYGLESVLLEKNHEDFSAFDGLLSSFCKFLAAPLF
jgi:hypothetical protein